MLKDKSFNNINGEAARKEYRINFVLLGKHKGTDSHFTYTSFTPLQLLSSVELLTRFSK